MNALTRDLKQLVELAEKAAPAEGRFRQRLHLMPPTGWLNDPNGLCQFKGLFHAFFQYSPFNPEGGVKMWGHCTSRDMAHWEYQGTALYPDQPFDCHSVYSGCALVEDGRMYLYYTGNVKLEDQEYDYVLAGREGNTVLVESEDGFRFGRKQLLMRNEDYPADLSCHVRDPKVWKQDGRYYMVQGVRTKEDVGEAQIFVSDDRISWSPLRRIRTEEPFGYMWECPDYMDVDGQKILSASVQGPAGEEISGGRRLRYQEMESPDSVKILGDASSVEVFVNEGEYVFTTRYYPGAYTLEVEADGAAVSLYAVE